MNCKTHPPKENTHQGARHREDRQHLSVRRMLLPLTSGGGKEVRGHRRKGGAPMFLGSQWAWCGVVGRVRRGSTSQSERDEGTEESVLSSCYP